MVTIRIRRGARLFAAEEGSRGGLQGEKLQPAQRSLPAAHLFARHLLLIHFPLHLFEEVRHFHLFAVPKSVTLHKDV